MAQFIIQARMSSSRLPGKVMMPLGGVPMLEVLHRRLSRAKLITKIVVATSTESSDDPIAQWCKIAKVEVLRGDLQNVASRFNTLAASGVTKSFVRICADSPFVDPDLIDKAIGMLKDAEADLVTSSNPRTTPSGMSVEVLRCKTFCDHYTKFTSPEHFEHVTKYFYEHPGRVKIVSIKPDYTFKPGLNLSVDTPADYERSKQIVAALGERVTDASAAEIIAIAERLA